MAIRWTPAELAEMARADAEIEASFRITDADLVIGRLFDREVILDRMDSKQKRIAEYQRRYREAHKEEIAESQRRYYETHKEEIAESQRRYREAHKEEIAESQRRYYEAHKEEIAEGKRELRDARIALGLTQKQAAELLGVSQPTVCYWETISPPKNWREMIAKMKEPA
ncbi:putative zinc finger/helix-turn-helix protein%2C YgiT family [uncultured Clostridium sp.]|nr:putative zinc finger/helix-turn-helix protein%2C YgiT family [uncultured Clostridium sp.]